MSGHTPERIRSADDRKNSALNTPLLTPGDSGWHRHGDTGSGGPLDRKAMCLRRRVLYEHACCVEEECHYRQLTDLLIGRDSQ